MSIPSIYPCSDKTHDFHCRYMVDGFCVYGYDDGRSCTDCYSYLSCSSCLFLDNCRDKDGVLIEKHDEL